ncbi:magnesium/cobalt transporter CorA [Thermodesulfobacteriota bacterium]
MPDSVSTIAEKAALSPGSLVYVGEPREEAPRIEVISYDRESCSERVTQPAELENVRDLPGTKWIRVTGVHDVKTVRRVGEVFGLHALVVEDVVNTEQRPKIEDFDEYLFVALKKLHFNTERMSIGEQHVSILLFEGLVVSFLEGDYDFFAPVRQRIFAGKRRIRRLGADYLAYTLVDVVVDSYFRVIEDFGDLLDDAEQRVFENPERETLHLLYKLRRADLHFRRMVLPLREAIGFLIREDSDLLTESTAPFLRDVQDHLSHTMDAARTHEETLNSLMNLYQNSQSNRLNEVMKFLTVVATIFIPMTFIAGVYGMNFKNMPELEWTWGYPMALILMAGVVMAILFFLHRKRWL